MTRPAALLLMRAAGGRSLRLVEAPLDVDARSALPGVVRRVEAAKRHARLATLALQLDLDGPPPARGLEEALELLVGWGLEGVREIDGQTRDSNFEEVDE